MRRIEQKNEKSWSPRSQGLPRLAASLDRIYKKVKADGLVGDDRADRELLQDELVESLYDHLRQERDKRILLYLADGLEYEEIAEREGLTMRATYMAVFHLRRRLENDAA